MGYYSIVTGKAREPSLHDWEMEAKIRKSYIIERILESEKNDNGCPAHCGEICCCGTWPDCSLGREFLSPSERDEERRKRIKEEEE